MRTVTIAALAALTLGLGVAPAFAQYGYDEDYRPRRRYEERYDYDRPRYRRDDYDRPGYREYGGRIGRICVTARGNCPTRPAPLNSSCGCEVPGFGFKRGAIGY
ncbi:hypothetical protein [Methylobacterium sp. SyP6R]|uniref:hypothetical protein n=1 Tax=Methylobacterium sp. SyP6R TaxID=2718876 RepID=UPI001F193656|nr:hypothetical protein [Methylobacterium sp. SyP6R]MCF4123997.1 hypothetical protein [Methylobacterium sp. SyP6R]